MSVMCFSFGGGPTPIFGVGLCWWCLSGPFARHTEHRQLAGNQWRDGGLVFVTEFGAPVGPRNILRTVEIAALSAGMEVLGCTHCGTPTGKVERGTVNGERVVPQPGGPYGGWITSWVVGPFKGTPGSWGGSGLWIQPGTCLPHNGMADR
jgi:hypothetical protein